MLLEDVINELRFDVTYRKCRPDDSKINNMKNEINDIGNLISSQSIKIEKYKEIFKFEWEKKLNSVVKEQEILKTQEEMMIQLDYGVKESKSLLEMIKKLLEMPRKEI